MWCVLVSECREVEMENSAGKVSWFCSSRVWRKHASEYSTHKEALRTSSSSARVDVGQNTVGIPFWGILSEPVILRGRGEMNPRRCSWLPSPASF